MFFFTTSLTYPKSDMDISLTCLQVNVCSWNKFSLGRFMDVYWMTSSFSSSVEFTCKRENIPGHAMWSLKGLRPPVHRKLSVTTLFGSVTVIPGACSAWRMHSSLCMGELWEEPKLKVTFGFIVKKGTSQLSDFKLTVVPSLAMTSFSSMVFVVLVRKLSLSSWFFNRSCSVFREQKNNVNCTWSSRDI